MKEIKHSPGPWKVVNGWDEQGNGKYFPSVIINQAAYDNSDCHRGCIVVNVSHDQEVESLMANAHLIASAPDMYQEIQSLRDLNKSLIEALNDVVAAFSHIGGVGRDAKKAATEKAKTAISQAKALNH